MLEYLILESLEINYNEKLKNNMYITRGTVHTLRDTHSTAVVMGNQKRGATKEFKILLVFKLFRLDNFMRRIFPRLTIYILGEI